MDIAILLFDRFAALDAVGPYEVLSRLPGARVTFVAEQTGPVRTDTGQLAVLADATLEQATSPDLVLVPGGPGQAVLMQDGPVHSWLRTVDATSTWTASVCTGSLILAAAGLLEGRRATSNWQALEQLGELAILTGADALNADELAGALIVLAETRDAARREAWAKRGAAFFRGRPRRDTSAPDRDAGGAPAQPGGAQPASGGTGAA